MNQQVALNAMEQIVAEAGHDPEAAHSRVDQLLTMFLWANGYEHLAQRYIELRRDWWCA